MKNEQAIELKEILKVLKKRFYLIIIVTVLAVLSAGIYSFYIAKPVYQAKTRLIIGNAMDQEGTKFQISEVQVFQRYLKTYSIIVKTTVVAERTIQKLSLNISPDELLDCITATPQTDTQFIDLYLRWSNPEEAVAILNTLSEEFVKEAITIYPTGTIKVMDKVKTPKNPISPNKKKTMSIAFIAGIMASIGIILILDYLDNTVKTTEDVENFLELPVIGAIPKNKEKVDKINLHSIEKPHHTLMECYRTLRTNVDFIAGCNNEKSILITSSKPVEGKSTTASMLAAVMAQAGKRTVLVDCDLRKPKIHNLFDLPNTIGLSNIISGRSLWTQAVEKAEIENLFIIPAGVRPPNPAELLSSVKMKELISLMEKEFDYVILDTPPVGIVTDAQILSQIVDGCILVVSSGEAEIKEAIKSKSLLQSVNAKIMGVSLNKIKDAESYYYSGYYGNGDNNSVKQKRFLLF